MARGRILSHFVAQALRGAPLQLAGEGTRRQDYLDVRDAAAAVWAAIEKGAEGVMNIGSGQAVSNQELAVACQQSLNSSSPIEWTGRSDAEEGVTWLVSLDRAREGLKWEPQYTLADSITAVAAELST
jgi:nucleoside-diphosphate-sugar epimerase